MGPILHGLMKLQSVENRLRAAKAKLSRSRRSVIIQENQVRSLQNALEAKREELQLTKVQSGRLELELKARDEEVSKLRAALNTAKSNKEYAAVLTQLNTTRADNSKLETQILELMKAVEADASDAKGGGGVRRRARGGDCQDPSGVERSGSGDSPRAIEDLQAGGRDL